MLLPVDTAIAEVVLLHDTPTHNLKRGSVAIVVEQYAVIEQQQYGYSLEGFNVPNVTIEIDESQVTSVEQWQKEMEILEKLHQLSVVKLVHLDAYIEKLLNEEPTDLLKVS